MLLLLFLLFRLLALLLLLFGRGLPLLIPSLLFITTLFLLAAILLLGSLLRLLLLGLFQLLQLLEHSFGRLSLRQIWERYEKAQRFDLLSHTRQVLDVVQPSEHMRILHLKIVLNVFFFLVLNEKLGDVK